MEKSDICKSENNFKSNLKVTRVYLCGHFCRGTNPSVDAGRFVTLMTSIKLNETDIGHKIR